MDVFLMPAGGTRYELYSEVPDDDPAADGAHRRGLRGSVTTWFRGAMARAEHERRHGAHRKAPGADRRGRLARARDRLFRWMAEAIAEQRLLWHLRGQREVTLVFPDDMAERDATAFVRGALRADADKHWRWLLVDSVGVILSLLLVIIPGPNLLLYYFGFRAVGHFLSLRGARQGLDRVAWRANASAPLAALRQALALPAAERDARVQDIAAHLRLPHLPRFFERTAVRGA